MPVIDICLASNWVAMTFSRRALHKPSQLLCLQWTKQLLAKGNTVIASCRNPADAAELNKVGVAQVVKLDVSDPASIEVFPCTHNGTQRHSWATSSACQHVQAKQGRNKQQSKLALRSNLHAKPTGTWPCRCD